MKQAGAAGEYFALNNTRFTAIYTSDLKRAHTTAQAILNAQPEPKPPFSVSQDLREQHFGIAEGNPWSLKADKKLSREEQYARGTFPVIYNRKDKFPSGESLNDLQTRAERAMEEIIMPHVWNAAKSGEKAHIAVVSHGLCISELIAALMRKDCDAPPGAQGGKWTGLMNTAWTRVTIDLVVSANIWRSFFITIPIGIVCRPPRLPVLGVNFQFNRSRVFSWPIHSSTCSYLASYVTFFVPFGLFGHARHVLLHIYCMKKRLA